VTVPAGQLAVLRNRNFRLYFTGRLATNTGTWMVPVALSFAVLRVRGSAGDVGLVLAAESAPLLVLLLVGGVVADRLPRRWVMVASDCLRCASEGTLAGLLFVGTPPLWVFMALAAVLGVGLAFTGPAGSALLTEIVPPDQLQDANALGGMPSSAGIVLGPVLAGAIVATAGSAPAIAFDSLSFAISAACLSALRIKTLPRPPAESVVAMLAGGWHELRSHTWLWVIVLQWTFYNPLVVAPFMALGPFVAQHAYGGPAGWGAILAVYGAGALAGEGLALRYRPKRPMVVATLGTMMYTLLTAVLAAELPVPIVAAAAFLTGGGVALFVVLWNTALQREVRPEALSRVSAYDWLGSNLLNPAGYAMVGPLSGAIGVSGVLCLAAGWQLVSSLIVLAVPDVRRLKAR
jgi:MFS family permease